MQHVAVYFVGKDKESALNTFFPFDSAESAESFRDDQPDRDELKVYCGVGEVRIESLDEV